jgi:membrane protease YdiL (CAAX protease family)
MSKFRYFARDYPVIILILATPAFFVLLAIIHFIISQIVLTIVFSGQGIQGYHMELATILSSISFTVVIIFFFRKHYPDSALGFKYKGFLPGLLTSVLSCAVIFGILFLFFEYGAFRQSIIQQSDYRASFSIFMFITIINIFMMVFREELFFRGLLLSILKESSFGESRKGIYCLLLLSGLIFGIPHMYVTGFSSRIAIFLFTTSMGVLWGALSTHAVEAQNILAANPSAMFVISPIILVLAFLIIRPAKGSNKITSNIV